MINESELTACGCLVGIKQEMELSLHNGVSGNNPLSILHSEMVF